MSLKSSHTANVNDSSCNVHAQLLLVDYSKQSDNGNVENIYCNVKGCINRNLTKLLKKSLPVFQSFVHSTVTYIA